jgi:catechol 2,3-dioxygenase-like lactoylglutathione lyase family enzyme
MNQATLLEVQPILPARNVADLAAFYTGKLGFDLIFQDDADDPRYAAVRREGAELHLQWQHPSHWIDGQDRPTFRIMVDDPDALFDEFEKAGALPPGKQVRDTDWGTREFAFYDPDGNGLSFYRDHEELI